MLHCKTCNKIFFTYIKEYEYKPSRKLVRERLKRKVVNTTDDSLSKYDFWEEEVELLEADTQVNYTAYDCPIAYENAQMFEHSTIYYNAITWLRPLTKKEGEAFTLLPLFCTKGEDYIDLNTLSTEDLVKVQNMLQILSPFASEA